MCSTVLHTITGLNVGGAETMLAGLLGQLDRTVVASTVLSLLPPGPLRPRVAATQSDILSIGMARRPRPRDAVRLTRLVRRQRPDLLHGWMYHGNLAASLGALFGRTVAPVIWSIHHAVSSTADETPLTRRLLSLSSRLSSRTAAITYCSRVAAHDHEKLGFDARRRVVIPNGIDCEEFCPRPGAGDRLRALAGIPPTRLVIGHVARAHPMKDQARLVHALARMAAAGEDVHGVFIGEGHEEGPVRHLARALGIDARVSTLGPRGDVAALVPGFDLFALSSAWGESFSLATAEAMASGVPPVVTAVGDCGWVVGPHGLVVPPGDTDALTQGLLRLARLSAEERRLLGREARQRIVERYSLSLYVRRHLDLYAACLADRPLRGAMR